MKFAVVFHFFIFFTALNSVASTFIVTSNADSGPGTLREAIQMAAGNGTGATDYIYFNLPDISRSGRTILLLSNLPALTSSLIIDGTTQAGTPFGISDARVQIQGDPSITSFICFQTTQSTGIEIYGLYLKASAGMYALQFNQANNIRFGAAGKGNIVTGFAIAFNSQLVSYLDPASNNIYFQSNLLGIDESGDFADYTTYNGITFEFDNLNNLAIGGLGAGEGNLICERNYTMDYTCTNPNNAGYVKIEGNKIGTDRTGMLKLVPTQADDGFFINGYNDGNDNYAGTSALDVDIVNNISVKPFNFFKITNYFKIQGNNIGVGADHVTNIGNDSYCLIFEFCGQGTIGGPNASDKNYIANFGRTAVYEFHCGNITITKNSFFCNGYGIDFEWLLDPPRPEPFVNINTFNASLVGGTALPNATIELFYDDECPGCEGKSYIGSTSADANGNWNYAVNNTGAIVATATDMYGATSKFSSATINVENVVVQNATCGKNNGSIKKLKVVSGTDWFWKDDQGNVVGHNTDLVDVPAGKYQFESSIGGNSCKTESVVYEVKNIDKPVVDMNGIESTQPTCGTISGSLKNTLAFEADWLYRWVDVNNNILCPDFSIQNPFNKLAPGDYYLKVALLQDTTCFAMYGPVTLVNQSGPTVNLNAVQISDATCQHPNGSIHNISYQNAVGPVYLAWVDSVGNIVGNSLDLNAVKAGKYALKFKDGGTCDTILTAYFKIADQGTITYDASEMIVQPSSCKGNDGAITHIVSVKATQFNWINTATGAVAGSLEDLNQVPAGTYQLILNNIYGCEISTNKIVVVQHPFLDFTLKNVTITDANCALNNGHVEIEQFPADVGHYTFQWIDSATKEILSETNSVDNLSPGYYILIATDANGCSQKIQEPLIRQVGKPVFDYTALQLQNDTCHSQAGAIENLKMEDLQRTYSWNWFNDAQQAGNTPYNLTGLGAGKYYATVNDEFGCSVSSRIFELQNIELTPEPPILNDQYIQRNTSTTIEIADPQPGQYVLLNDDLPGSAPLAISASGKFQTPIISADRSFFVRYDHGDCSSPLSKMNIKVFDTTRIFVPTAFTPNHDGVNDQWHVIVQGKLNSYHVSVFNRWGGLVFSSTEPGAYWDGVFAGQALSGTFVYMISAKDIHDKPINLSGTIIIIR